MSVSKYSKASCRIKKSVNDWKNSLKKKEYLHSIFTSYLPKGQFRLLRLKIF